MAIWELDVTAAPVPTGAGSSEEIAVSGATHIQSGCIYADGLSLGETFAAGASRQTRSSTRDSAIAGSIAMRTMHVGWFSEWSAGYLASARPVVVQDTGFSTWLRAETGVLPFTTPDEARDAIEAVNARYTFHCQQARLVADAFFDAGPVLTDLLERAMSDSGGTHAKASVT